MHGAISTVLALAALSSVSLAQTNTNETVLGVYVFSRHGDRTAKSTPPSNLTDLGYAEVYDSGTYFRNRYVAADAPFKIANLSSNIVKLSQIAASAPQDNVLMPSCQGWLQGLYPPVQATLGSQTLRNGTTIEAPLNGYQLIPIATVATGTSSENSAWLQGSSNCANAIASSNEYFASDEYLTLLNSTMDFYASVYPYINNTFTMAQDTYQNAYTIYDLINVAQIDNVTFDPTNSLSNETFLQLRTLADQHEFNLAYNASSPIRAVAGSTLAAQIVQALNSTITSRSSPKFNVQFGAYGSFSSFFGLANLTSVSENFYGIVDYASTMTFELFTPQVNLTTFPSVEDIQVRFLFHNGSTSDGTDIAVFPLFGTGQASLSWTDFAGNMSTFSIGSQSAWCSACGNSTGVCAPSNLGSSGSDSGNSSSSDGSSSSGGSGISNAVAGVIGAMVTLAVILLAEALIVLLGGFRFVSKRRMNAVAGVAAKN